MFPSIADIHKRLMEADQKTDWRTVSKKNIAVVLKTANAGYNLIDIFPAMLVLPYNKIHLLPHVLEQIKKIKEGIEK